MVSSTFNSIKDGQAFLARRFESEKRLLIEALQSNESLHNLLQSLKTLKSDQSLKTLESGQYLFDVGDISFGKNFWAERDDKDRRIWPTPQVYAGPVALVAIGITALTDYNLEMHALHIKLDTDGLYSINSPSIRAKFNPNYTSDNNRFIPLPDDADLVKTHDNQIAVHAMLEWARILQDKLGVPCFDDMACLKVRHDVNATYGRKPGVITQEKLLPALKVG